MGKKITHCQTVSYGLEEVSSGFEPLYKLLQSSA